MAKITSENSHNKRILSYSFPDIGTVETCLHKEGVQLYDFLESIKEIERLEHLDHLGKIREINKSAHYSRWEYVMLQLYFIDIIKEAKTTYGLSQSIEIGDISISSGEELIKCWVLLLNFSHLKYVFDAERVWLELFIEDDTLRDTLFKAIPSLKVKESLTQVFQFENFYALHQYLGMALLYDWKKHKKYKDKWPFDLWLSIYESYIGRASIASKIGVCKNIFQRIRRLVFLVLDLNHCPFGIRMNPSLLLKRIISNPQEFLYQENSSFIQYTDALERILFQNLYGEPSIVKYRVHYLSEQKEKYNSLILKETGKKIRINKKKFCEKIRQLHSDDFGKIKNSDKFFHYLRIELLPDEIIPKNSVKYYTEQQWLSNKSGLDSWSFMVTPVAFANRGGCVLDIFSEGRRIQKECATIFWLLIKYLLRYYEEYSFDSQFMDYFMAENIEAVFSIILHKILKKGYSFRFQGNSSPEEYNVKLISSSTQIYRWKRQLGVEIKNCELNDDRKHEIKKLKDLLSSKNKGTYLVCYSRIRIFDEDFKQAAEFDGIFIRILKHKLEIMFLEAKRGISEKSDQASNALKESLETVTLIRNMPRIFKRKELAYCNTNFEDF